MITLGAISDPFCFVQALGPLRPKSLPQNGGVGEEVILPYQGLGRVRHLGTITLPNVLFAVFFPRASQRTKSVSSSARFPRALPIRNP